jgi:Ca-activated chloride channel family protein
MRCSSFLALLLAAGLAGQIRVDSSLVIVPAHVTTEIGTTVNDLRKEHFHVFEDDVEQGITLFVQDDAPVSIGVLFDASGSMKNKIRKSSQAAAAFFKIANPQDEFFLVEFNERPWLAVPFTMDADSLYERIARTRVLGRTSLLDAIHLAFVQMKNARHSRKAIVIVSDGGDNRSRSTAREIKSAMRESDVQIYAMGIFDQDVAKQTDEERNGPQLLDELSEQSGGRHYRVQDLNELPTIAEHIGNQLRSQYVIGYIPANNERDGKYRRVKLTVDPPPSQPLRVYYRRGYFAPVN